MYEDSQNPTAKIVIKNSKHEHFTIHHKIIKQLGWRLHGSKLYLQQMNTQHWHTNILEDKLTAYKRASLIS